MMAADDGFEMREIPSSSRLSEWGYNAETMQARAVFPSGRSAIYEGVPLDVYNAVLTAPSAGQSFGYLIVNGGYEWAYEN
jgi:KTSC domain